MARSAGLLIATKKGLFTARSSESRTNWDVEGPFCESWPLTHAVYDPAQKALLAGGGDAWYGPAVWRSTDMGKSWTHSSEGLTFGEGEDPVTNVWVIQPAHGVLYAGVEPAGLFRSDDGGLTWNHIEGLRQHPSRETWMPGGGGLILHTIAVHPQDPDRIWVGISAVGMFETTDGGATWHTRNRGIPAAGPDEIVEAETGQCVHHFELDPSNPDQMFQQNHMGMYKSTDAGKSWQNVGAGLPSTFGFGAGVHPRKSGNYYLAPLNGDSIGRYMPDGAAAVWKSTDSGGTWEAKRAGLPQQGAYFGVLRQALCVDTLEPAGVYIGSSTGHLFASADEAESWQEVASYLPPISAVSAFVTED
jgi:hypothetical protein